jgi:hypothetical protein
MTCDLPLFLAGDNLVLVGDSSTYHNWKQTRTAF